jgi:hypothetical protein
VLATTDIRDQVAEISGPSSCVLLRLKIPTSEPNLQ